MQIMLRLFLALILSLAFSSRFSFAAQIAADTANQWCNVTEESEAGNKCSVVGDQQAAWCNQQGSAIGVACDITVINVGEPGYFGGYNGSPVRVHRRWVCNFQSNPYPVKVGNVYMCDSEPPPPPPACEAGTMIGTRSFTCPENDPDGDVFCQPQTALCEAGCVAVVHDVSVSLKQYASAAYVLNGSECDTGEPGDGEPGDGEPGDGEPGDGEPGDGEPGDGEPGDGEPGDGEPGDGEPGDGDGGGDGECNPLLENCAPDGDGECDSETEDCGGGCDPEVEECGDGYGSGNCSEDSMTAPDCDGDAVQCAIAEHTWILECREFLWRRDLVGDSEYRSGDSLLKESEKNEIQEEEVGFDDVVNGLDDSGSGFGGSGTCPADITIGLGPFGTIPISYHWICELAALLRSVIIAIAWVMAALIVFRRLAGSND